MSHPSNFPDDGTWIELPGTVERVHRGDVRPCECGAQVFNVMEVTRPLGVSPEGGPTWTRFVSVECPRCRLVSARKQDRRVLIARFDVASGAVLELERTAAR